MSLIRANFKTGVTRKQSTSNFPKSKHFLPPDTHPWPALFSCNSRFEILPFALLPTTLDRVYNLEDSLSLLLFLINKICEGVLEMQTKLHECFSIILPNPHIITGLFLFPLKTVENLFWCFQGVQKETSYMTWLRTHKNRTLCGMLQNGKCFY